jgi:Family of unknown function (DUF5309)
MAESMREAMQSYFATQDQLQELEKAITTDPASAGTMVPVEYDADLINLVVKRSPFLSRLMSSGRVTGARSKTVGFRRKKTGGASSFISETAGIPATTDSTYEDDTKDMTTVVFPLEISDMAQMGTQDVIDLYAQEISDGMIDLAWTTNNSIINGTGAGNSHNGLIDIIDTNISDLSGGALTKLKLDALATQIVDAGGSPSMILTSAKVKSQLEELLWPGIRQPPQVGMAFGYTVTSYNAPNGLSIPIIVDPIVPSAENAETLMILDESTLFLRRLMNPTIIPLAKTKLSTSEVIAAFETFYTRSEVFNGIMTNIETPVDS